MLRELAQIELERLKIDEFGDEGLSAAFAGVRGAVHAAATGVRAESTDAGAADAEMPGAEDAESSGGETSDERDDGRMCGGSGAETDGNDDGVYDAVAGFLDYERFGAGEDRVDEWRRHLARWRSQQRDDDGGGEAAGGESGSGEPTEAVAHGVAQSPEEDDEEMERGEGPGAGGESAVFIGMTELVGDAAPPPPTPPRAPASLPPTACFGALCASTTAARRFPLSLCRLNHDTNTTLLSCAPHSVPRTAHWPPGRHPGSHRDSARRRPTAAERKRRPPRRQRRAPDARLRLHAPRRRCRGSAARLACASHRARHGEPAGGTCGPPRVRGARGNHVCERRRHQLPGARRRGGRCGDVRQHRSRPRPAARRPARRG